MAQTTLSSYRGIATAMSTELNSLGNGANAIASTAIDNSTNLDLWDDLILNVTFGSAPSAGGYISVYILPSLDGTTYSDGGSGVNPDPGLLVGSFNPHAVTTAQHIVLRQVPLPPGKFYYLIQNNSGQAFPASSSTLQRNPYHLTTA